PAPPRPRHATTPSAPEPVSGSPPRGKSHARAAVAMTPADVVAGLRFLRDLPPLLRQRLDPDAARATVRQRLAAREQDFLALLRAAVFPDPAQPVHRLLARAGCAYGDVERLVR